MRRGRPQNDSDITVPVPAGVSAAAGLSESESQGIGRIQVSYSLDRASDRLCRLAVRRSRRGPSRRTRARLPRTYRTYSPILLTDPLAFMRSEIPPLIKSPKSSRIYMIERGKSLVTVHRKQKPPHGGPGWGRHSHLLITAPQANPPRFFSPKPCVKLTSRTANPKYFINKE